MYSILNEKKESIKEDAVKFTQDLIRVSSPSLQENQIAKLIEIKMKQLGYDKVFIDDAGNVIGLILGRENKPSLLLNCHMDTVEPSVKDGVWDKSPFSGDMENGRIYGLGASDCKSGIAAQVYAGAILKRSLLPLKGNIVVAATVAEKNGLSIGVRTLMEKTLPSLGITPDFAILGEPTDLGLYYGHDGWMEIEIKVEGTNPFQVDDAAHEIFSDFGASFLIKNDKPETMMIKNPYFEDLKGCRRATILMERRVNQSEEINDILTQIKHNAHLAAQSSGSVAVDVMVRQQNQKMYTGKTTVVKHLTNAWAIDPFNPVMERSRQALSAANCKVCPGKWELDRLGMGTAGSVFVKNYNVPAIGYGPGSESVAHKPNEYVEISNLDECVYGTAIIAHSLIGVPVFGWTSDEI